LSQYTRDILIAPHSKILFDELPNVERLYRLIEDIYLIRSGNDADSLRIERELYRKLILIYRNPIDLMSITRLSAKDLKNNVVYDKIF